KLVRKLWLIAAPLCRPGVRKFDQHMMHLLQPFRPDPAPQIEAQAKVELALNSVVRELVTLRPDPAPQIEAQAKVDLALSSVVRELDRLQPDHVAQANLELALNGVVRELGRLQIQFEILQQHVHDLESTIRDTAGSESRLSVVSEISQVG